MQLIIFGSSNQIVRFLLFSILLIKFCILFAYFSIAVYTCICFRFSTCFCILFDSNNIIYLWICSFHPFPIDLKSSQYPEHQTSQWLKDQLPKNQKQMCFCQSCEAQATRRSRRRWKSSLRSWNLCLRRQIRDLLLLSSISLFPPLFLVARTRRSVFLPAAASQSPWDCALPTLPIPISK